MMMALAAFVISAVLTWRFTRPESFAYMVDSPNERSLHAHPTPRGGGIAIVMSLAVCVPLTVVGLDSAGMRLGWVIPGAVVLIAVAYLDDRGHVPPGWRLLTHLAAVACLVPAGLSPEVIHLPGVALTPPLPVLNMTLLVFAVWMVNLYNFMDGMDGFAGGMAVIGFATLALAGWRADALLYAQLCGLIAAAAAGFLLFNFPPARIFLGDVGSTSFGFLATAFLLWGDRGGILPLWAGILVFSPFIVDATMTLLRRAFRGERVWLAHKSHYYQRLVGLGWSHRRTVLAEYLAMTLCALCALAHDLIPVPMQWIMLAGWVVVYALLMRAISLWERAP
jgi:UDP-N-acetylmuramyl pentapeptide phosphotransferase/UDP-N-acetylglucosamine-1-phosphate transferase